ncbi:MAG: thiamine phosphate synthase [Cytophaga sp.]|uniref:thiamine phosphate synthase n=1 Tax=Cytophaga sp. TaxID=29535 RepID=UPI003F823BE3
MFNIIVFTPEENHPHEAAILHALVRAYNITIHVRKPDFTEEAYRSYLTDYASILSHMVLHEHHDLAKEFAVKGVHLKERDRNDAKEIDPDVKVISTSLHNIADAANLSIPFEYIFFSPLFKSISKKNYGINNTAATLSQMVSDLKNKTTIPVVGLGGITGENIALVKNSGFDGAAILGAVWESEKPVEAFDRIYTAALNSK